MCPRSGTRHRKGFAVPLAILVVIALALVTALMLDSAVAEFRSSNAWYAESQATAAAETASAVALSTRFDTAALHASAGTALLRHVDIADDTVGVVVQALGEGLARLTVSVASGHGRLRVIVGRLIFLRMVESADVGSELNLVPLGSLSWVATP